MLAGAEVVFVLMPLVLEREVLVVAEPVQVVPLLERRELPIQAVVEAVGAVSILEVGAQAEQAAQVS